MKISTFLLILSVFGGYVWGQNPSTDAVIPGVTPQSGEVAKATDFSIPASPAFMMLNNNTPSRIQRFTTLRDFKVDWSLGNNYQLSPGIALEAMPFWLLFFDRGAVEKYQQASPIVRKLSTLSVSAGTTADSSKNWMAYGVKLNLYRAKDPMTDPDFLKTLRMLSDSTRSQLEVKIKEYEVKQLKLNKAKQDYQDKFALIEDSIALVQERIGDLERQQSERLAHARDEYVQRNWNCSYVDIAFGQLYNYKQEVKSVNQTIKSPVTGLDSVISFAKKNLTLQGQGYGVWVSGGVGILKNGMISGMMQYGVRPMSFGGLPATSFSTGVNLRYGNRKYNMFVETFYDNTRQKNVSDQVIPLTEKTYMVTLGGDWRVSRNVMLSFGIRNVKDFANDTYNLSPLINVNCLMR